MAKQQCVWLIVESPGVLRKIRGIWTNGLRARHEASMYRQRLKADWKAFGYDVKEMPEVVVQKWPMDQPLDHYVESMQDGYAPRVAQQPFPVWRVTITGRGDITGVMSGRWEQSIPPNETFVFGTDQVCYRYVRAGSAHDAQQKVISEYHKEASYALATAQP